MTWRTHSESYGSFYPGWDRIYVTQLPVNVKKDNQDKLMNKLYLTNSEYGLFYRHTPVEEQRFRYPDTSNLITIEKPHEAWKPEATTQRYQKKYHSRAPPKYPPRYPGKYPPRRQDKNQYTSSLPPLLPPLLPDHRTEIPLTTNQRTVPVTMEIEPRGYLGNRVRLPDIDAMDVQIFTDKKEFIGLYPSEGGGVESTSYPSGMEDVRLPDIKQLHLKFRMKDYSTIDFTGTPHVSNSSYW